jgi:hypothetical protein
MLELWPRRNSKRKGVGAGLRPHRFGFRCSQPHRLTAPLASYSFKYTMAARTTLGTSAVRRQMPRRDVAPVAADQYRTAGVTMGALAGWIVNIAGVDITKTCVHGDPPRHVQRLRQCRWPVHQFPVRMEGREVQRHVGA